MLLKKVSGEFGNSQPICAQKVRTFAVMNGKFKLLKERSATIQRPMVLECNAVGTDSKNLGFKKVSYFLK